MEVTDEGPGIRAGRTYAGVRALHPRWRRRHGRNRPRAGHRAVDRRASRRHDRGRRSGARPCRMPNPLPCARPGRSLKAARRRRSADRRTGHLDGFVRGLYGSWAPAWGDRGQVPYKCHGRPRRSRSRPGRRAPLDVTAGPKCAARGHGRPKCADRCAPVRIRAGRSATARGHGRAEVRRSRSRPAEVRRSRSRPAEVRRPLRACPDPGRPKCDCSRSRPGRSAPTVARLSGSGPAEVRLLGSRPGRSAPTVARLSGSGPAEVRLLEVTAGPKCADRRSRRLDKHCDDSRIGPVRYSG